MHTFEFVEEPQAVHLTPILMPPAAVTGLHALVGRLTALIEATVADLCRNPAAHRLLGMGDVPDERFVRPSPWAALAPSMLRADVVYTGGVPKVVEVNCNSLLGGSSETAVLTDAHLRSRSFALLGQGFDLSAMSPFAARARALLRAARAAGAGAPPVVALLGLREDWSGEFARFFAEELTYLRTHGLAAVVADPDELELVRGKAGRAGPPS